MEQLPYLMGGLAGGGVFVAVAERLGDPLRIRIYGFGLVVAALVYVGFALAAGGAMAAQELGGALIFSAIALAGLRGYPSALVLGWAGHIVWDVGIHAPPSPVAPAWYPPLCLAFDALVAGAILAGLLRRARGASAG